MDYQLYSSIFSKADYGKSTRKKSNSFFSLFLDNTPPVRIVPIFKNPIPALPPQPTKFKDRRFWWNPPSMMFDYLAYWYD